MLSSVWSHRWRLLGWPVPCTCSVALSPGGENGCQLWLLKESDHFVLLTLLLRRKCQKYVTVFSPNITIQRCWSTHQLPRNYMLPSNNNRAEVWRIHCNDFNNSADDGFTQTSLWRVKVTGLYYKTPMSRAAFMGYVVSWQQNKILYNGGNHQKKYHQ